jgi:AraC-like DNA-binding protein
MLTKPELGTSVTKVSFKCGFGNLGHFASAYKKAFGQSPSETLLRASPRQRFGCDLGICDAASERG